MKYARWFFDGIFILALLFILYVIGNEIYIGGSKTGGMVLGFLVWGYLGLFIPYLIGRIVSKK